MTTEQKAFTALIRAGLWGAEADASLFSAQTDWAALYRRGQQQALLGILLDGIQTLPPDLRPERTFYLQWCAAVFRIEETNKKLNAAIGDLYALLRAKGVNPVLLKGQGVARNYPHPLHRQCGDIDLFVGENPYELVNLILCREGKETSLPSAKHSHFEWRGVVVENHRRLALMKRPRADRQLQRIIARWHETDQTFRFVLEGCEVTVPPVEFDAVFLLQHMVNHLLTSGIGFRQVCDWMCLLHHYSGSLDKESVANDLKSLGLDKAARVFGAMAVDCLGLPETDLPLRFNADDAALGQILFDEIWDSGNFGKADARKKPRPKGYWSGKWHSFANVLARQRRLRKIAPAESAWVPVTMLFNFIKARFSRRSPILKNKQ